MKIKYFSKLRFSEIKLFTFGKTMFFLKYFMGYEQRIFIMLYQKDQKYFSLIH